ncbi:MAG: mannose-phosphate guanylyltransferase / mannose-6-phosphate isomerase [Hyphomicrobiales bacterium]|jgi:mannose-1-phosphate guanylyltransferase/mannose-6-phosphate isomerase|nr:mannose-phosphate guanylyltransferase / mannose-6-phosphate isomerase [Hyphomicrobiales bacterium]
MTGGRLIPVIMCGGAGTRLWPVSRASMPKQFVPLIGDRSTFQQTLARVSDPDLFDRPIVITNGDFRFIVAEQLRELGIEADIVLEPMRRDSGPAVAVAAALAVRRDPDSTVLVLAADHVVRKTEQFHAACRSAAAAAAKGLIVTFGILPTSPATSYGYIRPGAKLNGAATLAVDAFVEKPDAATAERYVAENYLWNSGNFTFRADVMLKEIQRFEPEMAEAARAAVASVTGDLDFMRIAAEPFARAPKKSIDYAVMERTKLAAVVPADIGWTDIGSWGAVWEELPHDAVGNATSGPTVLIDSHNSLVRAEDNVLTAVVGLDNVVVVATGDAVLVTARDKAENVKTLVEQLRAQNRREAVEHRRIYRPWGYYQGVDLGSRYQVKRIMVKPGARLSLQKHFHRAEHWVVVTGTAEVTVGDKVYTKHENESVYIPIGSVHRLANPGKIALELIEVQVGAYLGEDDIVRLDDVYGRG